MPDEYMYMLSEHIGSESCFVHCGYLWEVLKMKQECLAIDFHAVLFIQKVSDNYDNCYNF